MRETERRMEGWRKRGKIEGGGKREMRGGNTEVGAVRGGEQE